MDVVRQRLERRHVDDLRRVGEPAVETLPHQVVDRRHESRERLARARRRGDERVAAGLDRGPRFGLRRGRRGETLGEPVRNRWVEQRFRRRPAARDAAGPAPRRFAPLEVEAKSVSKRLGPPWVIAATSCAVRLVTLCASGAPPTASDSVLAPPRRARRVACRMRLATWPRLASLRQNSRETANAMTSQTQPTVALNDGATMPQFGLGVFQTPPDETERVVKMAVDEAIGWSIRRRCIETRTASAPRCLAGLTSSSRPSSAIRITASTKLYALLTRA